MVSPANCNSQAPNFLKRKGATDHGKEHHPTAPDVRKGGSIADVVVLLNSPTDSTHDGGGAAPYLRVCHMHSQGRTIPETSLRASLCVLISLLRSSESTGSVLDAKLGSRSLSGSGIDVLGMT